MLALKLTSLFSFFILLKIIIYDNSNSIRFYD